MCSPGTWWRTVRSRFPVGKLWVLFIYSCRLTYRTFFMNYRNCLWIRAVILAPSSLKQRKPIEWISKHCILKVSVPNPIAKHEFKVFLWSVCVCVCARAYMWGPGCCCGAVTHGSLQLGDILMGLDPRRAHTLVIMCWWTVLWLFPFLVFLPIWLWISLIVCIFYGVNGVYCRRWMHMDVFA